MIVNEQGDIFLCDCGFSWRRGHSGSHNCANGLRSQRDYLMAAMEEISKLPSYRQDECSEMARDAISKVSVNGV